MTEYVGSEVISIILEQNSKNYQASFQYQLLAWNDVTQFVKVFIVFGICDVFSLINIWIEVPLRGRIVVTEHNMFNRVLRK